MNLWEALERIGLITMLGGFIVVGWFGWQSFSQGRQVLGRLATVESRLDSVIKSQLPQLPREKGCDQECVRTLVSEAIATISGISSPVKQEVVERVVEKVNVVSSGPKTQYVSLGSGETSSNSWIDLPGAEVTFDLGDFGAVKAVFFEAQLQSPSGRVMARLWDKRAETAVVGSELSHVAGDAKLVSASVSIPSGGRTIGVQLRSETQQLVKVLSSRLRVDSK